MSGSYGSAHVGDFQFDGTERYEVLSRLGAGGMGVVFKVFDRETRTNLALKALHATRPDALLRFKNEFRALQGIRHPNLVRLGELGEHEGIWFFTMELVEGVDFLTHVQARRADSGQHFHEARLRNAIAQLARGLGALHDAGKIHRDVKPLNIRVTEDGRAVLLDFGLVIDVENPERLSEGWVIGTAAYMAPEQAYAEGAGPAADFYALGTLMFQAMTGRVPFEGGDLEVLMQKQREAPPRPSSLGPELPEDLDQLCVDLLQIAADARPSEADILRRLGDQGAPRARPRARESGDFSAASFVGREAELQALHDALEPPRRARTFVVRGPSGIGKTALVQQFLAEAAMRVDELVVLSGRCFENESVPFKGVDGIIDALTNYMRSLPREAASALLPRNVGLLAGLFPVLRRVDVVAESPRVRGDLLDVLEQRRRALVALRELFTRIAMRHPLIVTIDDMQWADADSLSLLGEVMQPPDAPPLLLVLSARPTDGARDAALADLPGDPRSFVLGPLETPEATRLAADLLARARIGEGQGDADTLAREAAGHPMFLQELVRHVASVGMEQRRMAKLDDAVHARIHKLAAPARRIFELVCVAGAPTSQETLALAAELDFADYLAWAEELREARLVRTGGGRRRDAIEPYHNRIREAALRTLADDEVRGYHRALAMAFEASGEATTTPDLALHHYSEAGDAPRAAYHAERAADRAREALAFDRAAARYRMALRLGEHDADTRERLELALADTLCNAGRGAEATETYMRLADRVDSAQRMQLQRRAAEQLLFSGHVDEGVEVVRTLLAGVGDKLPESQRGAILPLAWQRLRLRLRGLSWKPRSESDLRPRDLARVDLYLATAAGLSLVDNIRAMLYQARGLRLALQLGERERVMRGLAVEGVFLAAQCSEPRARAVSDACRALAVELGDHGSAALSLFPAAAIHYFIGNQWRATLTLSLEGVRLLRSNVKSAGWETDTLHMYGCFCSLYLGELAELSTMAAANLRDAERRGDRYLAVSVRTRIIAPWLVEDDPKGAERSVDEAIRSWSGTRETFQVQHFWELHSRCEIALYSGDARAAATYMASRFGALKSSMLLRVPIVALEIIFLRGRIALARAAGLASDSDRATLVGEVGKLAREAERTRQPVAPGLAALLRAGAAHVVGNRGEAVAQLRSAVTALDETETRLFALPARWYLGKLLGGDEGAEMMDEAEAWAHEQGVRNFPALARMLTPGLG